jgi:hypothetical protein
MAQQIDTVEGRLQRLEEAFEGADHGATTRMAARLGVSVTRWVNAKSGRGLSQRTRNNPCSKGSRPTHGLAFPRHQGRPFLGYGRALGTSQPLKGIHVARTLGLVDQ